MTQCQQHNSRACGALASFRLSLLTQREAQNCAAPASSPPPSVSSVFTFLLNSLNASNQALRVSPVYRASMRLGVCERTRLIPVTVLHSFLSGVTRAARRHAPLFIINEGEDRGKGQWGERKRAAGTHAQLRKKEEKKAGSAAGATCLRVRKGGERETEGEGGEKGEEIQRERKLEYRRQRQQHHRGPEQQKKRQAGRSLRQRTRGM